MKPDSAWAKMSAAAEQLSDQYCSDGTLKVTANRRSTGLLTIGEGLAAQDKWTDVFELVRKRRVYSTHWTDVQTLEQAAEHMQLFLRERPDQAPIKHDG